MSYRVGHHSTSDDSTRYRSVAEVEAWKGNQYPTKRIASYLTAKGWWTADNEAEWQKEVRDNVLSELRKAEAEKKPHLAELFNDVYDVLPTHLHRQQQELHAHIAKYGDKYPVDEHEQ
jgi:2-oxoisovalerate dehydrogenase E1 component alpha subunit